MKRISHSIPRFEQKFELFPELPVELRLKIWRYVLAVPGLTTIINSHSARRLIVEPPIGFKSTRADNDSTMTSLSEFHKTPALVVPSLFSVCKESREMALAVSEECLATPLDPRGFRFRPVFDTIYMRSTISLFYVFTDPESFALKADNIQHLAIDLLIFEDLMEHFLPDSSHFVLPDFKKLFGGVKELVVVLTMPRHSDPPRLAELCADVSEELDRRRPLKLPPVIKMMNEKMLIEYVEMGSPANWETGHVQFQDGEWNVEGIKEGKISCHSCLPYTFYCMVYQLPLLIGPADDWKFRISDSLRQFSKFSSALTSYLYFRALRFVCKIKWKFSFDGHERESCQERIRLGTLLLKRHY